MNLSDLFGGKGSSPATAWVGTGTLTNSVVTASPALLMSACLTPTGTSSNQAFTATIFNGSTKVLDLFFDTSAGAYSQDNKYLPPGGIDCPNGIRVTCSISTNTLAISYILK